MKRFIAISLITMSLALAFVGGGMEINGRKGDDGLFEWNSLPGEEEAIGKEDDGLFEWNDFTDEEYS
ncbi:hypothetical protein [Isachenkonia alkalipeptolytica]|uniref:Uncharacterized protein n=1 Tax=Isachenkonia alkalipeptolytica TaxID=2565777 RepID=A0AA44BCE6_9CLOT|nr:hypothetical protein [Isachenkonia alkalipeptolytica]NBG87284.1 hypothetical protein [Isachenkonia alkalipeptolytica]